MPDSKPYFDLREPKPHYHCPVEVFDGMFRWTVVDGIKYVKLRDYVSALITKTNGTLNSLRLRDLHRVPLFHIAPNLKYEEEISAYNKAFAEYNTKLQAWNNATSDDSRRRRIQHLKDMKAEIEKEIAATEASLNS